MRRAVAVAVGLGLSAAVLAGCGRAARADAEGPADPLEYAYMTHLPERLDKDGTTFEVGSPTAEKVVHVYEDMRCPVCGAYEAGGAAAVREEVLSGEVRAEYTLASFLDDRLGGSGSVRAANALRAAFDRGKFIEYHDILFAHQPEESVDGYTDAFLLHMASQVQGLRSKEFDSAVRTMKYRDFVSASQRAYEAAQAPGTPAFVVNGTMLDGDWREYMFDRHMVGLVLGMPGADHGPDGDWE
ncbi:thioredoxin domain-containing protein [Streptomyces sp. SID5785]|uniref:DsbA family protein n=1 Tax=Streptomyces sp. SID5785 TaxID=2690309 RepID=UPI001360CF71|nr:thioredoxin domain-containing protein [Streptomyces sp. SID5785]MZD07906.1 thioredoxin domain-containing protein [Streptomyces sp. SID5785]